MNTLELQNLGALWRPHCHYVSVIISGGGSLAIGENPKKLKPFGAY